MINLYVNVKITIILKIIVFLFGSIKISRIFVKEITTKKYKIMESAVNKVITFGVNTKMTVLSERVVNNESKDCYSLVTLQGSRGGIKQAKRRFNNTYRIL
jgi:hypothetical protein